MPLNSVLHGKLETFYYNGEKKEVSNYLNGVLHGKQELYDACGKLRLTQHKLFGDGYGSLVRYYGSGDIMYNFEEINDLKTGEFVFYNIQGVKVASILFDNNYPTHYRTLENNQLSDLKAFKDNIKIVSKYKNNQVAFSLQILEGEFHGELIINSENNFPNLNIAYNKGVFDGERKEYHKNGKIYKIERFVLGDYQGLQEYYDEMGNKLVILPYQNDHLHGNIEIYKNGKLNQVKKIDTDEYIETK